mgnify:CR=1 FL=1
MLHTVSLKENHVFRRLYHRGATAGNRLLVVYCLRNGLPLDMDVYDLAEWCALSPLSEISIENGNAPVEYPDFTRGAWNKVSGFRHAFKDSAR